MAIKTDMFIVTVLVQINDDFDKTLGRTRIYNALFYEWPTSIEITNVEYYVVYTCHQHNIHLITDWRTEVIPYYV